MKLKEIMTSDIKVVEPETSLIDCARQMRELDVGVLPVCENDRLVGLITDRDIVLRGIAEEQDLETTMAQDIMTSPVRFCYEDDDIEIAGQLMKDEKIRRILVLDRNRRLCGIISLGDFATKANNGPLASEVLEKISRPSRPRRAKVAA